MEQRTCPVAGCHRPIKARGLCDSHYSTARKRGDFKTSPPGQPLRERFMAKVQKDPVSGCWNWTAFRDHDGYGRFGIEHAVRLAHRVGYEMLVGPIPDGLQLDHLCRNTSCVNPSHLDPVTPKVNTHRGYGISALNVRKTHCKHGHEFTPENTYRDDKGRACKTCWTVRREQYKVAKSSHTTTAAVPTQ